MGTTPRCMLEDGKLVWMPAHQGIGSVGVASKSDGNKLTMLEWRAKRLADGLAKQAALTHAAPQSNIEVIKW